MKDGTLNGVLISKNTAIMTALGEVRKGKFHIEIVTVLTSHTNVRNYIYGKQKLPYVSFLILSYILC